jgi:hypothetical protein
MRKKSSPPIPEGLDHFRREIEQWRRRQSGRKRLPREFWAQAVALAQTHGVHPTARTLGLKYSSLQQHLNATVGAASQAPPNRCEFVELLPGAPSTPSITCAIEWQEPGGTRVRMHIQGACLAELLSFAERLRSGRS